MNTGHNGMGGARRAEGRGRERGGVEGHERTKGECPNLNTHVLELTYEASPAC